jgi:hypothetical protein
LELFFSLQELSSFMLFGHGRLLKQLYSFERGLLSQRDDGDDQRQSLLCQPRQPFSVCPDRFSQKANEPREMSYTISNLKPEISN